MRGKVQETIWRKMQRIAALLSVLALTCSAAACGASDQRGTDGTQTAEGAAAGQEETAGSGEAFGQSGNEQQDEAAGQDPASIEETAQQQEGETTMRIQVTGNGITVVYELNDSQAARDLWDQLPMTIEVEDYSTNEKIFYPPRELDTGDAPRVNSGAGTLAYYAPWGDVVMFYDTYSPSGSLYELGQAVSGAEGISGLSGTIEIRQE